MPKSFILTALAVAVVSLSACSAGGQSGGLDADESPLAVYWDAIYGGYDQDEFDAQQLLIEEKVAACMTNEGFEYIPVDWSQNSSDYSGEEWLPEDEEWVAQYGWGIVTYPGQMDIFDGPDVNEFVDPNQEYVASLSESEQSAYYEILYGVGPSGDDPFEEYEYNVEEAGCYGQAQFEVQGPDPWTEPTNQALLDSMHSIWERVESDPRIAEANAAWASCMEDSGVPGFESPHAARGAFYEEVNALYENATEDVAPDDPKLTALGNREIELALADLACATEAGTGQVALTVLFELEEQFIADNKVELDALLAASEQGR
jgi:hypothetical protein